MEFASCLIPGARLFTMTVPLAGMCCDGINDDEESNSNNNEYLIYFFIQLNNMMATDPR